MFGHDDDTQQTNSQEPMPDAALATNDVNDNGVSTPTPVDDTAGTYMTDDGVNDTTTAPAVAAAPTDNTAPAAAVATVPNDDLLDIKQQALQQLSPLIGHLDQSPEEKFRTTMMMIQASDNDSLIKAAYEAAQQIPDEKARAQALLDIVNEINYFTQHAEE